METQPNVSIRSDHSRNNLAAFDFDGILTFKHSFWRFLVDVAGPWRFFTTLVILFPTIIQLATDRISYAQAREKFTHTFLKGESVEHVHRVSRRFMRKKMPGWVSIATLQRLRWHQSQGHTTVLLSHYPDCYLLPWGQTMGFDLVHGTSLEVENGHFTGRFVDTVGSDAANLGRLENIMGDLSQFRVYTYGDKHAQQDPIPVVHKPIQLG